MVTTPFPDVLAIGDSLTAGYGLPAGASFAARLQDGLRRHHPSATVRNAGVSGDTTEGALRRLPALLDGLVRTPDLAIVELGANDLLRAIAPARTRANLDRILATLRSYRITTLLATFELPPAWRAFAAPYDGMYAAVAARHGADHAPFFPPGVLGHPELTLPDRLHPNGRAIEMVVAHFLPHVLSALDRGSVGRSADRDTKPQQPPA